MTDTKYDIMSLQSIKRLEKLINQCDKHAMKTAVTATGFITGAFYTKEISDEEQAIRMDQVNDLTTKFIRECSCGTKFK